MRLDSSNIFWKTVIVVPFLLFKETIRAHLLISITSITHKRKRISLLNFLNNWILGRLAPQILSVKNAFIFRFLNFLITVLFSSSANWWFKLKLFSIAELFCISRVSGISYQSRGTAPPEKYLSKYLQTTEARILWYSSHFKFLTTLNALSCYTLSDAVLLGKF